MDNHKKMRATKITLTVDINALSIDTIPGLLMNVSNSIQGGIVNGELSMDDGDSMNWCIEQESVIF